MIAVSRGRGVKGENGNFVFKVEDNGRQRVMRFDLCGGNLCYFVVSYFYVK